MLTENLQEMIKTKAKEETFRKLTPTSQTWDEERKDGFPTVVPNSHSPIPTNDHRQTNSILFPSPETELIPQESATEDDLIAYTKFLHARMAISTVQCYWLIGKSILSFYQGKYGTGELQRISEATGIGRDTLTKACKFARQYTEGQVKEILKGKFVLSWFGLAQSLSVAPQNLIAVYQASSSPGQFHNGIIKLKPPVTKKAKEISSAVSGRIQANGESSGRSQDVGNSEDVHKEHTAAPDKQISNPLEAEIDDLRATLNDRDCQIADLRDLLEKKTRK